MDDTEPPSFSLAGSLRRIGNSLLSALGNRVDLFALELHEEKQWLVATFLWAGAALFFCGLAITFVAVTVVWLTPEEARPRVLEVLSAIFIFVAALVVARLVRVVREKPPPFSETVSELKKDIECMRSQD